MTWLFWLSDLFRSDHFIAVKNLFEFLGYAGTIIGVGGVFYAVKSFKKSEADTQNGEKSRYMDNSIKVLNIFSDKIIPLMTECRMKYEVTYQSNLKKYQEITLAKEGREIDDLPVELKHTTILRAKNDSGYVGLFNKLEQVCAYISHQIIIDEVVYPTVHNVFLDFCNENMDILKHITSDDVPYSHVHDVIIRWSEMADKEFLERKKEKLQEEIALIDNKL